jgi:prepilin-type N-terminal cleavage/methylation domain-containing protein
MNTNRPQTAPARRAFTLIELLMVIGIIGILAGMILVGGNAFIKKGRLGRVKAELSQLEAAIENYKTFKGVYPPDGKLSAAVSPLYYELMGTTNNTAVYAVIKGDDVISKALVQATFGRSGFLNASTDQSEVRSFLTVHKGAQTKTTSGGVVLLVAPVEGPDYTGLDLGLNPWCYVSSNPTNSRITAAGGGYDLWADISVRNTFGGYTTYRICNWQRTPIVMQ